MPEAKAIKIHTKDIVNPFFGGVGFHVFHHLHPTTKDHLDQVIFKRWRELNPSFARLTDHWNWDQNMMDVMAEHLLRLKKDTDTIVYITTWNPKDTSEGKERADYAKRVVDNLEYYVRKKGADNVKYYCMTNELSLKGWGVLREDLPKFMDYHRLILEELKKRELDIMLLATDASPIDFWHTIEWAVENMDDITGIYGGHHYINDHTLDDLSFYSWFLSKMEWGSAIARYRGKDFILGEFGCKQDGRVIDGIRRDVCIYWDTPQEPMVGIQLAEAVIAALNGGIYALAYWTFSDFPDSYRSDYINKWGTFKWSGNDYSTRAHYYAYGLLTKFFRGPAVVYRVECDDELLRSAIVGHHYRKTYSIAIVNRMEHDSEVKISLEGRKIDGQFRKYVYDPKNVPWNPFGDLQGYESKVPMYGGVLTDCLSAGTLTVYTTAYEEQPPAAVKGVRVEKDLQGKNIIEWQANTEADLCYYRIYKGTRPDFIPSPENQIGTTIAEAFIDEKTPGSEEIYYKVTAVDKSGNQSITE